MWGMTELSPVGSIGLPTGQQLAEGMSGDDLLDRKVCWPAYNAHNIVCAVLQMRVVSWRILLVAMCSEHWAAAGTRLGQ
jgi:hypothetical protein